MSLRSNEAVIRMGPITVIALLIVIALATLGVLSLTTAQASQTAVAKQDVAIKALYANETEAQKFLASLDTALQAFRGKKSTAQEAAAGIASAQGMEGAEIDGITIKKAFENESRKLTVVVVVRDDLNYQVVSWKTSSTIDSSEQIGLWQGGADGNGNAADGAAGNETTGSGAAESAAASSAA